VLVVPQIYEDYLKELNDNQLKLEFGRAVREDSGRSDYEYRCLACESEIKSRGLPI